MVGKTNVGRFQATNRPNCPLETKDITWKDKPQEIK